METISQDVQAIDSVTLPIRGQAVPNFGASSKQSQQNNSQKTGLRIRILSTKISKSSRCMQAKTSVTTGIVKHDKPSVGKAIQQKIKQVNGFLQHRSSIRTNPVRSRKPSKLVLPSAKLASVLVKLKNDWQIDEAASTIVENIGDILSPICSDDGLSPRYRVNVSKRSRLEDGIHSRIIGHGLEDTMLLAAEIEMAMLGSEDADADNLFRACEVA